MNIEEQYESLVKYLHDTELKISEEQWKKTEEDDSWFKTLKELSIQQSKATKI